MSGRRWLLGGLIRPGATQGFFRTCCVVELQAVQVELDRGPGVRGHQIGEVVGQLRLGQIVDLVVEVVADAANGARVGLDGLGLQPLELEVLEMRLVLPVKVGGAMLSSCWFILTKYCRITPRD
jgi:hypothetical protein